MLNLPYNPKFKFTDNRPTFPTASYIEQVTKLSKDINLYGKRRIAMMKILSNRYIGAWRYLKVHLYGENLLHGNEIYEYDVNATMKAILELTTEELNILHEIMRDALDSETLLASYLMRNTVLKTSHLEDTNLSDWIPASYQNKETEQEILNNCQIENLWIQLCLLKHDETMFPEILENLSSHVSDLNEIQCDPDTHSFFSLEADNNVLDAFSLDTFLDDPTDWLKFS